MTEAYGKAVESTFIKGLRSVLLVDDAFPTLADSEAGGAVLARFKERGRATALYASFKKKHLPCDVENTFSDDNISMLERMRKCDLIVLDYHLDADEQNTTISFDILSCLADSGHFNTVILYTKALNIDLKDIWLDIAAAMRPDLLDPLAPLEVYEEEQAAWLDLDPEELDRPSDEALARFLMTGKPTGQDCGSLIKAFKEKMPNGKPNLLLEPYFRFHASKRVPPTLSRSKLGARALKGRCESGRPMWLQCGRCFIVVIKKQTEEGDAAEHILGKLREAIVDWNPNFLQMLISEIQNRLELEALATDTQSFSDTTLQAGLSHYLLSAIAEDSSVDAAVESTVDRIVETVRHKLSGDADLREFARMALADRRMALGSKLDDPDAMVAAAAMAHLPKTPDAADVLFFLNAFLSSESSIGRGLLQAQSSVMATAIGW